MLTIDALFSNKNSKAYEVFDGVQKSWPDQITKLDNSVETDPLPNSMFWGFVGNNRAMVKKLEARNHKYWFTDTPYLEDLTTTISDQTIIIGAYARTKYMQHFLKIVKQIDLKSSE